ncbi:MAG TPA: trimeric intracellular cation channel family protein [Porphyromonadaceae bacterium]|nr:trimeric intracellular cation channel family protein [Porphyromonadaceae bacterium]HBL34560.1 trimeric intracellular cation channel family protein [Porphyromonadaceae bacterium]HBX21374.1 trimeric intracellular cation channel family protein [Porphyromonadaceae bacterium]HCM21405.1 trimeric intracellular cation channel family protein [Porphyromonadaceae bacterium]
MQFFSIIEFLGTFAFAISGIRLASAKHFDWFGAFVVGFVTAIGGGTLRDLFIDVVPFWMENPVYLWATFLAFIFVIIFHKQLVRLNNTFFIFDSIGLGLFVVVGVEKTVMLGFDPWVGVIMGVITGAVGGMLRDVLINEIPLIFRKEIYALACVIGGIVFVVLQMLPIPLIANEIITAGVVILIRILAVKFRWHLPIIKGE